VIGLGQVVLVRGLRMKRQPAGRSSAGPYPLSLAGALRDQESSPRSLPFGTGYGGIESLSATQQKGPTEALTTC